MYIISNEAIHFGKVFEKPIWNLTNILIFFFKPATIREQILELIIYM